MVSVDLVSKVINVFFYSYSKRLININLITQFSQHKFSKLPANRHVPPLFLQLIYVNDCSVCISLD